MSISRGRPVGYKLSEESKDKIRESRTDTSQSLQTKRKISRSLKRYFKTPAGIAARKKCSDLWSVMMTDRWHKYAQTESYEQHKQQMSDIWSDMLIDMHKYNEEN